MTLSDNILITILATDLIYCELLDLCIFKEVQDREKGQKSRAVPQILLRLAALNDAAGRRTLAEGMFDVSH